jgi:hypothetical protein
VVPIALERQSKAEPTNFNLNHPRYALLSDDSGITLIAAVSRRRSSIESPCSELVWPHCRLLRAGHRDEFRHLQGRRIGNDTVTSFTRSSNSNWPPPAP